MAISFRKITVLLSLLVVFLVTPLSAYKTEDLKGTWALRYNDGFGYEFRLKDNYRAYVVLYLQGRMFVFKGVYNLDEGNVLRINISEMKDSRNKKAIEHPEKFIEISSSVFLFQIKTFKSKNMVVAPKKIRIDGRASDGYFEKEIALVRK